MVYTYNEEQTAIEKREEFQQKVKLSPFKKDTQADCPINYNFANTIAKTHSRIS